MSKETTAGVVCRCGNTIYFDQEHHPHCPERDNWKPKTKSREDKSGSKKEFSRGKSKRTDDASTPEIA